MRNKMYLMESEDEAIRLDIKTDGNKVEQQALWAGITKGMRIADLGCGSGKTTFHLNRLVQPGGEALGLDFSPQRIDYAKTHYQQDGIQFQCRDIRHSLDDLGKFDFIWIRFVLEYYKKESFDIVQHISSILKPGGILCLIDLDYNLMIHYGHSQRLEATMIDILQTVVQKANFDLHVGKKLYSFLYDLGFRDIDVSLQPHNLIFGPASDKDTYNWSSKMAAFKKMPRYHFDAYDGNEDAFLEELNAFLNSPRRFTYTPLIMCKGRKP
jgi:SAM-dependent methyltransferase